MEVIQDEYKRSCKLVSFLVLIFNIRNSLSLVYVIICDYKIGEDN